MIHRTFVPMLQTPHIPIATGEPDTPVLLSAEESALLALVANHPEQKRTSLAPHPLLMQVARARAADMAVNNYVAHVDKLGFGPNWHVRQTGYMLPPHYQTSLDANNVESIAAGQTTAAEVMQGWEASPNHLAHVLGLREFYALQTAIGIGYAYNPDARYRRFWVLISAPWPKGI